MSKKEEPPKTAKVKKTPQKKPPASKTPEKKVKKDPEDWIEEILPKQRSKVAQKEDKDLSDVAVNRIPGIGPAVAEKLMSAGYITLAAVAHASPVELVDLWMLVFQ